MEISVLKDKANEITEVEAGYKTADLFDNLEKMDYELGQKKVRRERPHRLRAKGDYPDYAWQLILNIFHIFSKNFV